MIFDVKFSESETLDVDFSNEEILTDDVELSESEALDIDFSNEDRLVNADFGEVQSVTELIGEDPYTGSYRVTPKVEAQTLPTRYKAMKDNLTVSAIPYAEVSNTSNGTTVTIG